MTQDKGAVASTTVGVGFFFNTQQEPDFKIKATSKAGWDYRRREGKVEEHSSQLSHAYGHTHMT